MAMTQLLFSFRGRLNRKPYWTMLIAMMVVFILVLLLALAALREYGLEFLPVTIAIILLLYIPLIWIGLALGAKRLHDRDKSAWWLLVFYALPTIFEHGRRSNGGCAIHPFAPHQLRNYRLGLR
jgi:uncharacterized membrane protein YhaH (DUF805 family)